MVRLQTPVLTQQQKIDKQPVNKKKEEKIRNDIRKELGVYKPSIDYDKHPEALYSNFSDEEKEIQKKKVTASIIKRRATDKTFKRKVDRISREIITKSRGKFKTCTICGKTMGRGAFDRLHNNGRPGNLYRPYCHKCRSIVNHEYYLKNKEKWSKNDS